MVCVVIPTFNNQDSILKLLGQLPEIAGSVNLSVIVVDNASTDGTETAVKERYPGVELIRLERNTGGSGGFITGVEAALKKSPDYIWLLDDDVILDEQTLENLLSAAKELDAEGKDWGAVGSLIASQEQPERVTESGSGFDFLRCKARRYNHGRKISEVPAGLLPAEHCAAASLLTTPGVIKEVGFFEDVFIHFDDVEWCHRLNAAGKQVYCRTDSIAWHPSGKSAPPGWIRYYDSRNLLWYVRRHYKLMVPWVVFTVAVRGLYLRSMGLDRLASLYFKGLRDAFSGRLRQRSELENENIVRWIPGTFESRLDGIAAIFFNEESRAVCESALPDFYSKLGKIRVMITRGGLMELLLAVFRSVAFALSNIGKPVVIDGICVHRPMLPVPTRDIVFVFAANGLVCGKGRFR